MFRSRQFELILKRSAATVLVAPR